MTPSKWRRQGYNAYDGQTPEQGWSDYCDRYSMSSYTREHRYADFKEGWLAAHEDQLEEEKDQEKVSYIITEHEDGWLVSDDKGNSEIIETIEPYNALRTFLTEG